MVFAPGDKKYPLENKWNSHSISLEELDKQADLSDVRSLFYLRGDEKWEGGIIRIRKIYYSAN